MRGIRSELARQALILVGALLTATTVCGQMPDPPGQVATGTTPKYEAYLFAHMMHGDYLRLYYSVSVDGLHWKILNQGKRIFDQYRGHPDICQGHDGKVWYLYYEQYPGVAYGLSVANNLNGPWFQAAGGTRYRNWDKYTVPDKARHGSMLPITRAQYQALIETFNGE